MDKVKLVESKYLRTDIPDFRPGDTVSVHVRVVEGDKERIQEFEGIVISRRGSGLNETFTVRKVSDGVGVERIFPLHHHMGDHQSVYTSQFHNRVNHEHIFQLFLSPELF